MGLKHYLTYEEESELVEFIIKCSKMAYGKTRQDVMKLVDSCLAKKEDLKRKSTKLSNGWGIRFLQRQPQLSLHKGDSFAVVREDASSYDVFKNYFDLLESVLTEHGLKDKPSQVYNCDESGMPLQHKIPKILSVKGTKKVCQVSSGNKTQITIPVQLGKWCLRWLCSQESILMLNYQMVKCLVHFMACRLTAGWIKSYSLIGFLNISLCMLCLKDHSFYCWMGIHLITR